MQLSMTMGPSIVQPFGDGHVGVYYGGTGKWYDPSYGGPACNSYIKREDDTLEYVEFFLPGYPPAYVPNRMGTKETSKTTLWYHDLPPWGGISITPP